MLKRKTNKGRTFSKKWRKNMSEAHKGYKRPKYVTKKIVATRKKNGYKHSRKTCLKISKSNKGKPKFKGKTYEEIYGEKRAKEIKQKQKASSNIGKKRKGKTWIEIFGEKRALEMKENLNKIQKGRSYEERFGIEGAIRVKQSIKRGNIRSKKFKDTSIELVLDKILEKIKKEIPITYTKQKYELFGTPDRFIEPNICIFADGDYWHCNPKFYTPKFLHKNYNLTARQIWSKDNNVNNSLQKEGYKVLRFWESDINKNEEKIKCIIEKTVKKIKERDESRVLLFDEIST